MKTGFFLSCSEFYFGELMDNSVRTLINDLRPSAEVFPNIAYGSIWSKQHR